jgi:osmotically-inducible protein OsmY
MKEHNHKQIWQNSSDLRIWKKITDRLNKHPKIDASDIEVEVNKSEVTLKGKADAEEEKQLAENIAMSVRGVSKVENHLHTEIGLAHATSFLVSKISGNDNENK